MVFLVEYDRRGGYLLRCDEFADSDLDKAKSSALKLEIELNRQGKLQHHEVNVFKAHNKQAFQRTHSRYFVKLNDMVTSGYVKQLMQAA